MEDFFLFLRYKNKTIKFKITDPSTDLEVLMSYLRKAVDNTGARIFDLPEMIEAGDTLEVISDPIAG